MEAAPGAGDLGVGVETAEAGRELVLVHEQVFLDLGDLGLASARGLGDLGYVVGRAADGVVGLPGLLAGLDFGEAGLLHDAGARLHHGALSEAICE